MTSVGFLPTEGVAARLLFRRLDEHFDATVNSIVTEKKAVDSGESSRGLLKFGLDGPTFHTTASGSEICMLS